MTDLNDIAGIRRNYGELSLNEENLPEDPLIQFNLWFKEVIERENNDPTAMVLSTVDSVGHPDSRVVLLKGLNDGNFIFYTNYRSTKAKQIQATPYAALNFYWPQMVRQVRIRGQVQEVSTEQSDQYFLSRPIKSQFSAIISPQSNAIADRKILEQALNQLIEQHGQKPVLRPDYWGGYMLIPEHIEFWQGRDNRLHDRIAYCRQEGKWLHQRLAP